MFAVVVVAGALVFNSVTNSNKTTVSSVTLSNLEALTMPELPDCNNACYLGSGGCYCFIWYYDQYPLPHCPFGPC